jgi:hypothetical protein
MTWTKKYSYYNTKKVITNGTQYDSKFEAAKAQELEILLKAKEIQGYDPHYRIPLIVNGYTVADYYIDFAVYHNDETVEYIEMKGYPTDVWKLKWRIFCALYEDNENVKITLEMQGKQRPPKLRKKR